MICQLTGEITFQASSIAEHWNHDWVATNQECKRVDNRACLRPDSAETHHQHYKIRYLILIFPAHSSQIPLIWRNA
jgi:hypothetical protein